MSIVDDTRTITEIIELEQDRSAVSPTFSAGECLLNLGKIPVSGHGNTGYTYIITTRKQPNSDGTQELVLSAEPIVSQQQVQQIFLTSSNITNQISLPVSAELNEATNTTGQPLQFTLWSASEPENEIGVDQLLQFGENLVNTNLGVQSTNSDLFGKNKTVKTKTKQSQVRMIPKESFQTKTTQTRLKKLRSRSKVSVKEHLQLKNNMSTRKKTRKIADWLAEGIDPRRLERNAEEVRTRFEKGCGCPDANCFDGLSADFVCKHRLNIAELTRAEHDLYLMGVTMATLSNPEATTKHTVRQRLRSSYVFLGQEVCLSAWLYLENCTQYQVKRIRKHLMTNGVAARVHGNQGKKPHNTIPFDSYKLTFEFLENWFAQFNSCTGNSKAQSSTIVLPPGRTLTQLYKEYQKHFESEKDVGNVEFKILGHTSFIQFVKTKFPFVRFSNSVNIGNRKTRETCSKLPDLEETLT